METLSKRPPQNARARQNDRLLRVLNGQPVDRPPVWLMRQAGRYLPEYREVRAQAGSFMNLCRNPELASEVAMQPLRRFPLDAAIVFSDILTIPDALGLGLEFTAGEGPRFCRPLHSVEAIGRLKPVDVRSELGYVFAAVEATRQALGDRLPLIGFAGSPWTLAAYMIEGHGSRDFNRPRTLLYSEPAAAGVLLELLSQTIADYLQAQVEAGADVVMLFDTWGGLLPPAHYLQYSLYWMGQIIAELKGRDTTRETPVIIFSKGCGRHLDAQAASGAAAIGLDWTADLAAAARIAAGRVALQGNLDPAVMTLADTERATAEVDRLLTTLPAGTRHIFNLGHGITPEARIETVSIVTHHLAELK